MNGWQTEEAGRYELGRDLDRASPTNKTTRLSPRNGLKHQMTKSNRNRASLRLRSAQGKVLRAIRVQRAMADVAATRQKARNNWQRGASKMATVMGFKWLGTKAVLKRKRSIFGNVRGGPFIDDASMPRVSLHNNQEGEEIPTFNRRGSTVSSMTLSRRPTSSSAATPVRHSLQPIQEPLLHEANNAKTSSSSLVVRRETAADAKSVEKQMKIKELKKKMKGAVGKVRKFVRTVRLSYTDTFSGKNKVSLTELLGRLRNHYDPDGIHADPHDNQHEFYTDLALLQRESLKHDVRVRRILDFIWTATDRDGSGTIDKEEYMVMCRKVYRAIVDDTNSPEADAEITRIAEEDWDADRQGHDHLNYERFTRAWFQLADHWTHDLSADSYEKFLSNIFTSLTERDVNGNIVWRNDRDIHHYDPDATEEERGQIIEAGFQNLVVPKTKKKKKIRVSYMDDEAMEKYRQRMALKKKKSKGGNVVIVQEGDFQRNTRLAKISSRNGLFIGSVVPPPEDFDDVHTHKNLRQSAFMRISLKGGPGVYNRGFNSDSESVALAGNSFMEAYPTELRNSASKLPPALSSEAKANAKHLLQTLWSSGPLSGAGGTTAGSPGGAGGWLTNYVRPSNDKFEEKIERAIREQAGVGGGYFRGEAEDNIINTGNTNRSRRPQSAHPEVNRRSNSKKRNKQLEKMSLRQTLPSSLSKKRPQTAGATRVPSQPDGLIVSRSSMNLNGIGTRDEKNEECTEVESQDTKKTNTKQKNIKRKTKKLTRPTSAIGLRRTKRKNKNSKKLLKRPRSAVGSRTRIGKRRQNSSLTNQPETEEYVLPAELLSGGTKKYRRRPKSAQPRKTLNVSKSEMFKHLGREENLLEKVKQKIKHSNRETKGMPRITLQQLNSGVTQDDVQQVFAAMGVIIEKTNIVMTSKKQKASIYFKRFTDYKLAIQMLGILTRSQGSNIFETRPAQDTTSNNTKKVGKSVHVSSIAKIRVPKIIEDTCSLKKVRGGV